jgi:CDP-diacylglycerol--inositol 3-phosphatidyltransferase
MLSVTYPEPHVPPYPDGDRTADRFLLSLGYCRIVLAVASLYYMPLHPRTCSALYSISCLLDALDGYAARYFEQSTRFGAVLDMVTDRCTTSCLLVFLSIAFPRWAILFQGLISIDLSSHYMHMYATLVMGGADTSHKKVDKSRSWILNQYYTNKVGHSRLIAPSARPNYAHD